MVWPYWHDSSDEEIYAPRRQDQSAMTKRQRAKYLDEHQDDLLALPTGKYNCIKLEDVDVDQIDDFFRI
jgi:hypothetical protein